MALDNAVMRARIETLTKSGIIEVALQNPSIMSYMEHWETRAENAERLVQELAALLREADKLIIWEHTPLGDGFQERVEAVLPRVPPPLSSRR